MNKENKVAAVMRQGFTLVELLVVVAILGILATMAVINIAGKTDDAKITTCNASVKTIRDAAVLYQTAKGKFPKSIDDLIAEDSQGRSYLSEDSREDPWNNEYKFETKGVKFIVISAGPDGDFGTDDDIRSDKSNKTSKKDE